MFRAAMCSTLADATIHLRVPALTKARWVRESRAAGVRLGVWITRAVEVGNPDAGAYCPRCECDVTPYRDEIESVCPRCRLVL